MKIIPLKELKQQVDTIIEDMGDALVRSRSQQRKRPLEHTRLFVKSIKHYLNQVK